MSLANTLSVLLNFKADNSGLDKFMSGLSSRMEMVESLNKKLQSGADTVNRAMSAAAAYLAVGALKSYTAEATEAATQQAKLVQALKQTGQYSSDYLSELQSQASAIQQVTGLEDEKIAAVQRELVFSKLQRSEIERFTRLTIDLAAAKEMDVVSASKAVAKAVQGEGDELKRYIGDITLTGNKVASLGAGLEKFAGQSEKSFSALPKGMRELSLASKEAQQSAGNAIIAISNPFLSGLADGLRDLNKKLSDTQENGSAISEIFTGASKTLGDFLGANLSKIALLAGAILALKAGSYGAQQAISLLAQGFTLLTKGNLLQIISDVQGLSKEIGILKTLATGGWPAVLAAGLATVGVALAGLAIGSVVINSIESAQLQRLEREKQIRDTIYDQTQSLRTQAREIDSITAAREAQNNAQKLVDASKTRIAELEAKKAKDDKMLEEANAVGSGYTRKFTSENASELDALKRNLPLQEATLRTVKSDGWVSGQIKAADERKRKEEQAKADAALVTKLPDLREKRDEQYIQGLDPKARISVLSSRKSALEANLAKIPTGEDPTNVNEAKRLDLQIKIGDITEKIAEAKKQEEQAVQAIDDKVQSSKELQQKQALFELDTAILEAQADGNQELVDKLTREKEETQALNEMGMQSWQIVQNRLDAESELQKKARERTTQEQQYGTRIADLERERARISEDRFLTEEEKQRQILPLLEEENRLIAARIALLESELKSGVTDERKGQITTQLDSLRSSQATNAGDRESNRSLGVGDEINAQLTTFQSGLGTRASAIANLLTGPIKAGIGALRTQFQALLGDTDYWTQKLGNIAGPIMGALTGAIADMFQQWIAGRIKAMIVSMTSSQKEGAADTDAKTPGATLAAISSFGIAVVIGLAAIAAVLASGGFAEGGQVRGPGGPKSDSIITRLSDGEYVIPAERVNQYGVGFFDSIRSGKFAKGGYALGGLVMTRQILARYPSLLRDTVAGATTSADTSSTVSQNTRLSTPTAREILDSSQSASGGFNGNLFVMLGEDYLHSAMGSTPGQAIILRTAGANRRALGIPT